MYKMEIKANNDNSTFYKENEFGIKKNANVPSAAKCTVNM